MIFKFQESGYPQDLLKCTFQKIAGIQRSKIHEDAQHSVSIKAFFCQTVVRSVPRNTGDSDSGFMQGSCSKIWLNLNIGSPHQRQRKHFFVWSRTQFFSRLKCIKYYLILKGKQFKHSMCQSYLCSHLSVQFCLRRRETIHSDSR